MALIGSIAISMQAETGGLSRGLARSSGLIKAWSAGADADFRKGSRAVGAGLAGIGDKALNLGVLMADAVHRGLSSNLVKGVGITVGEAVSKAAAPVVSSFSGTFAMASKAAASKLSPLAGVVSSTAKATGDSLKTAFGPVASLASKAGKGASAAFAKFASATNLELAVNELKAMPGHVAKVAGGFGTLAKGVGKVGWGAAKSGASAFASSLVSVGSGLAKIGAVGAGAFVALGVKAGASAAHLTEAFNKTDQVFGSSAGVVKASANAMSDAYGTAKQEYLDGAAALGGQLQGVGYAEKDAAALSVQLANLAADAGAFRDVGFDEALTKIRAGLSGESEPLKAWGIMIDDNAVKTQALAMGLVKAGQEMDNSAKVQARLALIQQGLAKDSGALSRESTGTAAQISEFWGRLAGLMETIGQTTAPILGAALQGINTAIVAAGIAWEDASSAVMGWFGVTTDSLEGASGGVGILQTGIGYLADGWDLARGGVATFFSYFESGLSTVSGWLASILDGLSKIGAGDWAASARDALQGYSDAAKGLSESLAATAGQAFERESRGVVDGYWAQARAKIDAARQELATSKQEEIGKPKATEAAPKKTGRKAEFAEASRMGSKEAASIVLRSRYGMGKDGAAEAAKQTASNTKEIVPTLKEVASAVKAIASPPVVAI